MRLLPLLALFASGCISPNGLKEDLSIYGRAGCALGLGGAIQCFTLGLSSDHGIPKLSKGGDFVAVAVGRSGTEDDHFACGVTDSGSVECWGDEPPELNLGGAEVAVDVDGASSRICALLDSGEIRCSDTSDEEQPQGEFEQMELGTTGSGGCGLRPDGSIDCWNDDPAPDWDSWRQGPFIDIGGGWSSSLCAIHADGSLECRGGAEPPQGNDFVEVTQGGCSTCGDFACARHDDGAVECWEDGDWLDEEPPDVPFVRIGGGAEACGLRDNGKRVCWE